MKRVAIIQSSYIPWKGYFDIINMVDEFILYDDAQYSKGSWRNRNKIKTKDGLKWLTIPISTATAFVPIKSVTVAKPGWAGRHWKTISGQYSQARYFSEYQEIFADLYQDSEEQYLSRVNYGFIKAICEILSINTRISWSMDYHLDGDRTEKLVNMCRQIGADRYLTGPVAKEYLDESLFKVHNIDVQWMDYRGYPVYNQLFCPPFSHEVSILDLIFNEGARGAREHMLSFSENKA